MGQHALWAGLRGAEGSVSQAWLQLAWVGLARRSGEERYAQLRRRAGEIGLIPSWQFHLHDQVARGRSTSGSHGASGRRRKGRRTKVPDRESQVIQLHLRYHSCCLRTSALPPSAMCLESV